MRAHYRYTGLAALALALFVAVPAVRAQDETATPPPPARVDEAATEGVEVQTRGPVHEAYAAPTSAKPQPGPVVAKKPPAPVKELPPDQKPEGDNVQWIPGYWAWDRDASDFIWVSGFWRIPPPGRRWVPGYWNQVEGGWQWVPGFWASSAKDDVAYLDQPPPESLENGPNTPAPNDDTMYIPGSWVPGADGYAWQPGFWTQARPGWVWVNPSYAWTPAGYSYVDGYWDYDLADRGVLFAPVAFTQPLWQDAGYAFTSWYAVDTAALLDSLFVGPYYDNYYFGDYYAPRYARLGYRPWFSYGARHYDPLFAYNRWWHRDHFRDWDDRLRRNFWARRGNVGARPPHTLAEQNRLVRNRAVNNVNVVGNHNHVMVRPINQINVHNNRIHVGPINRTEVARQRSFAERTRDVAVQRSRFEARGHVTAERATVRNGSGRVANHFRLPESASASRVRAAGTVRATENRATFGRDVRGLGDRATWDRGMDRGRGSWDNRGRFVERASPRFNRPEFSRPERPQSRWGNSFATGRPPSDFGRVGRHTAGGPGAGRNWSAARPTYRPSRAWAGGTSRFSGRPGNGGGGHPTSRGFRPTGHSSQAAQPHGGSHGGHHR